jgi:hypothetical protein
MSVNIAYTINKSKHITIYVYDLPFLFKHTYLNNIIILSMYIMSIYTSTLLILYRIMFTFTVVNVFTYASLGKVQYIVVNLTDVYINSNFLKLIKYCSVHCTGITITILILLTIK